MRGESGIRLGVQFRNICGRVDTFVVNRPDVYNIGHRFFDSTISILAERL